MSRARTRSATVSATEKSNHGTIDTTQSRSLSELNVGGLPGYIETSAGARIYLLHAQRQHNSKKELLQLSEIQAWSIPR